MIDPDPDSHIRHTILADGEPIGVLHALVFRAVSSVADTDFSRQQGRRSLVIGAFALLLAASVSWWLARTLLAPIQSSISSVARPSKGDYSASTTAFAESDGGDELTRLAHDLERLRRSLEATQNSRRRLLADISHELRTPLTILSGEIAAVRDGVRTLNVAQFDSFAEEVMRLERLVDDLNELALSDVGGLRYEFHPVALSECVENVIEVQHTRAMEARIDLALVTRDQLRIDGDARRLHQLFSNLIDNSIAYTDAPGRVAVTIKAEDGLASVIIEDTPPGVSRGAHERLFESLYRDEESRNRRSGGSGLGLSICHNIVAAHGGRICSSPSLLGGLRIDVELPLERNEHTV